MTDKLKEAIAIIKSEVNMRVVDRNVREAIDTVLEAVEKPLPIDEIIKVKARTYAENNTDVNAGYILNSRLAFMAGAKWMRDLIQDGRSK